MTRVEGANPAASENQEPRFCSKRVQVITCVAAAILFSVGAAVCLWKGSVHKLFSSGNQKLCFIGVGSGVVALAASVSAIILSRKAHTEQKKADTDAEFKAMAIKAKIAYLNQQTDQERKNALLALLDEKDVEEARSQRLAAGVADAFSKDPSFEPDAKFASMWNGHGKDFAAWLKESGRYQQKALIDCFYSALASASQKAARRVVRNQMHLGSSQNTDKEYESAVRAHYVGQKLPALYQAAFNSRK